MRLLAPRTPRVEKLERRGDARSLVRALDYQDTSTDHKGRVVDRGAPVRARAVTALAGVDSAEAHDGIVRALGDSTEEVRVAAIDALRARGGHGAVDPLAEAAAGWTDAERADSREAAVSALESLQDPDVPLRVAAALIARVDELDAGDGTILRRLAEATRNGGVQLTVSYLLSVLGDSVRGARAVPLLVSLAPESVPALMETLLDPLKGEQAAIALGYLHAKEAVEPLCRLLLESDDPRLRRAAAWALGEVRDPVAVEALLLATSDRAYDVRAEASAAFDKFGNGGMALAISALLRPQLAAGAGSASGEGGEIGESDVLAALGEEARAVAEHAVDASPEASARGSGLAEVVTRELEDVRAELERERRARAEAEARAAAEPPEPAAAPEPALVEPAVAPEPAPVEPAAEAEPATPPEPATAEPATEPEPAAPLEPAALEALPPPEPRATQHAAPTVPEHAPEATPTVEQPAPAAEAAPDPRPQPRVTQPAATQLEAATRTTPVEPEPEPEEEAETDPDTEPFEEREDAAEEPALPAESLTSMDIDALAEFYDIAAEAFRSASRIGREDKAERWRALASAAVDEARDRQRSGRWADDGSAPRKGGLLRRRRNRLRDQLRMAMVDRDGAPEA